VHFYHAMSKYLHCLLEDRVAKQWLYKCQQSSFHRCL